MGGLLYLVKATKPDLAYAISTVSKYNQCYDETHWSLIKRIFRYIQGTKQFKLQFRRDGNTELEGYCDASWSSGQDDPRSTSGYVFLLHRGAVSWNSRRQSTVALLNTEPEYLSLSTAVQKAIWLRSFCIELGIQQS